MRNPCRMPPSNVLLIAKSGNPSAAALKSEIRVWLAARGIGSVNEPAQDISLAIVLGGDGTILGAARKLAGSNVPIFGINFGNVGFLSACQPAEWQLALPMALSGQLAVRSCIALRWQIAGSELSGVAANDVVIGRGALARLANLSVVVNSNPLGVLRSDGLVVSTPLGSTGYFASAGGSLLLPEMPVFGLASVCTYPSPVSPLVLPYDTELKISLENKGSLTVDGQAGIDLQAGAVVLLRGWLDAIRIMGTDRDFFVRLRGYGALRTGDN